MDSEKIKNALAKVGKTFNVTAFQGLVDKFQTEVNVFELISKDIKVQGTPSEARSIELAGKAKKLNKAINDAKLAAKRPYLDFNSGLDEIVRPVTKVLTDIEKSEKAKCKKYRNKVLSDQRAAEEMQRKARLAKERFVADGIGDTPVKTIGSMSFVPRGPVRKADEGVKTFSGSSAGYKTVFKAHLTDISKVPAEYLMVNQKAIDQAIKDGARSIPGFEIKEEVEMKLRG